MLGSWCVLVGVAVVTCSFTEDLTKRPCASGTSANRAVAVSANHLTFHHAVYSKKKLMTSARYIDEERSNTGFDVVPIVIALAITYPLLPLDIFVVFAATIILTYVAHIYVHVHFHLTSSWLQRSHWFLRLQRLHVVHHLDMRKNHAVLMPGPRGSCTDHWLVNATGAREGHTARAGLFAAH